MNTKIHRRGPRVAAVLAAVALTVTACSANDGGSSTTQPAAGATAAEDVVLEVWDYLGQGVSDTAMDATVAAFEDANPGITVKRTSFAYSDLATAIVQGGVGGSVPDVAIVDVVDTQNFAALGLLQDVTDQLGDTAGEFFPGPWQSTQVGGKTYGRPLNSNNLALYYNKDLFEAAGVDVPTTWDEFRQAAQALTSGDNVGVAMSAVKNEQGTFQFLPFLWQAGGDLDTFAEDGATALEFLGDLIQDGSMSSAVANYSQEDARTQFVNGKAAMMINGPWELQNLKDAGINYGVAPLPAGAKAATGMGGENVVTFAQAAEPEAAVLFMEYLTGAEGAKTYCDQSGQLSSRVDLEGQLALSSDPDMQVFEAQIAVARARAYGAKYNEISAAVQEALQKALTGAASAEDAAAQAAETITPLLP